MSIKGTIVKMPVGRGKCNFILWSMTSGTESFFSLPEVIGGGHPESPLIAAGLQGDLPFWPNLNLNGDPAFVVGKAVLEKYYPIQLRGNDKLGEFNETDLILMTVK